MGKNRDVKRRRKGDSTPVRTDEKDPFSREREREGEVGRFFFLHRYRFKTAYNSISIP